MELLNELADLDIAPAAMAKVQALFAQQQAKLAEKDFKITALTHELAYYSKRSMNPSLAARTPGRHHMP